MTLPSDQPLPWEVWADQLEEEGKDTAWLRAWLLWGAVFHGEGTFDLDDSEIYNGDAPLFDGSGDPRWDIGQYLQSDGDGPIMDPRLGDAGTSDYMEYLQYLGRPQP